MRIYLAGPMTGLTMEECSIWRDKVGEDMGEYVACYSPCRNKDYLKGTGDLPAVVEFGKPLSTSKAIVARDYNDVSNADVILCNMLGAKTISIGTVSELAWAWQLRIPIVLIMEEGNVHDHSFIREMAHFRVNTLEEGIAVTKAILFP